MVGAEADVPRKTISNIGTDFVSGEFVEFVSRSERYRERRRTDLGLTPL